MCSDTDAAPVGLVLVGLGSAVTLSMWAFTFFSKDLVLVALKGIVAVTLDEVLDLIFALSRCCSSSSSCTPRGGITSRSWETTDSVPTVPSSSSSSSSSNLRVSITIFSSAVNSSMSAAISTELGSVTGPGWPELPFASLTHFHLLLPSRPAARPAQRNQRHPECHVRFD